MTTQTLTPTDFLLARIAEDEEVAREATPGPWVQGGTHWRDEVTGEPRVMHAHVAAKGPETIMVADMNTHPILGRPTTPPRNEGNSEHIARHDPARVMAECEAKRRIVAELQALESVPGWEDDHMTLGQTAGLRFAFAALALPYADHPDYREEWRP